MACAILAQMAWLGVVLFLLSQYSHTINTIIMVLSLIMVLWLMNKRINPAYKLAWTILILLIPVFGAMIYLLFGQSRIARKMRRRFDSLRDSEEAHLNENPRIRALIEADDILASGQSKYIRDFAGYPLYGNVETKYYSVGDDMFPAMLEEVGKAEQYIFLEYFIVSKGYMWNTLLDILIRKVEQGVDVRFIYDDLGCAGTLPHHYYRYLQSKGIKCGCFNPLRPVVNVILNNRDHRKILVVDGKCAFTGGLNLADEYVNQKERFGHWKDAGVRIKGPAVWSFTAMFLQMWSVVTKIPSELDKYAPPAYLEPVISQYEGFVQPYCDMPLDDEVVGENVYLNIITKAKKYVYIFTPYLIIDNEMMQALCLASKSGVDVRIVTPEIPDKKSVYLLTQSYYEELLEAGVRIYQYLPGFIHSKCMVCDDEIATVGSINLDYRSLYLHFECGAWLYKNSAVLEVKDDCLRTFEVSREITIEFCKNRNMIVRGFQSILRLFAPML